MPIFSDVKPELKCKINSIINLVNQKNINNEELTEECKNFLDLIFLYDNKSYIHECYEAFSNYIIHNLDRAISIPDPVTILTIHLSFLYGISSAPIELSGEITSLNKTEE